MASNYITVRERDLGGGVDKESAENNIPQSFSEDLLNIDPAATGGVAVRTGYEGYLGYLPARVKSIEYTDAVTDNICLYLDEAVDLSSVNLSRIKTTPVILLGKTSAANTANVGAFPNNQTNMRYYSGFSTDIRKTFLEGTNTITIEGSEHGIASPYIDVYLAESTSAVDTSNRIFYPDSVTIHKDTYDITITYTNDSGADFSGFIYLKDRTPKNGSSYVTPATAIMDGGDTFMLTAATHNLSTFNILPFVFQDTGTVIERVSPAGVTVTPEGTVFIEITNTTGAAIDIIAGVAAAPALNTVSGSVAIGESLNISIPNLTTEFLLYNVYFEDLVTGELDMILPNTVTVDNFDNTATVSFVNTSGASANFLIVYESVAVNTNKLCLTGPVISTADMFIDEEPQLTLYGLPHSELYGPHRTDRQGWVNHIDNYKSALEERLIAGLGGNLFSAQLSTEGTNADSYIMPSLRTNMRGRIASETTVGPVFYDTGEEPGRTRGYILADNAGAHLVNITSATYNPDTGLTDYLLSTPNIQVVGDIATIFSTVTGEEDLLTVSNMGHSRLNGIFKIKAVDDSGVDSLVISVENAGIISGDYNEVDAGGTAGVFSDRLTLLEQAKFLPGDIISSELFTDYTAVRSIGTTLLLREVTELVNLPGGLRVSGKRIGSVLSLANTFDYQTVHGILRGDMLRTTAHDRKAKVVHVRTEADETVTISADGNQATVTLSNTKTNSFTVGTKFVLLESRLFSAEITVSTILSETEFTFDTSITGEDTGVIQGRVVQLDETALIETRPSESVFYSVVGRWIPVEAPLDDFDITPKTKISYFDSKPYTLQEPLRSVVVQDNMYFTNGEDSVMKFDGQNIYRAGLFRWQPHLYVTADSGASGKIILNNQFLDYDSASGAKFEFSTNPEDIESLMVGQQIIDSKNRSKYTITKIETLTSAGVPTGYVYTDRPIDATGSGDEKIGRVFTYRYYFRLNAVDANNNAVASAVTGADDFYVSISEDSAIKLKLVGMPIWDNFDYSRIELEIYRTKSNDSTSFCRVTTLPVSFNNNQGYIEYTDTASDFDLIDFDNVNSALLAAELGTTWSEPLRAKYITTANNRLILGNVRDYPTLDLQLVQNNLGPITQSVLAETANSRYLFRKNNLDPETITNMVDRAAYEFVTASEEITSITNNSGESFTVEAENTLSEGDWVYLFHDTAAPSMSLTYAGHYQVSSATTDDFTIDLTHPSTYTPANEVTRFAVALDSKDIPVLLGTDLNYGMDNGNRSSGAYEFTAVRRLANAINSSMRQTNKTIIPSFEPWMIANAGNEFNAGQLLIKQPRATNLFLELVLPALNGKFSVFVNNIRRGASQSASAVERVFPSRVLMSYPNYPEIFDAPTATLEFESESAVDVNSADGQEVTALMPFFGDSAFGSSQKGSIVVIFKESSIYLFDISAKVAEQPPVQKLETQNKGCSYPASVSVTKDGIMFANYSGIYKLQRDLSISYIGKKVERFWKQVNRNGNHIITATHFSNKNQYKLSVPTLTASENSKVLVYNHTREYESESGRGSWTVYDNHAATGWANQTIDSYFSTVDGQVFKLRNSGTSSDFRDDSSPILWKALLRAMDFGDSAVRKIFAGVVSHFRTIETVPSVSLKAGVDLSNRLIETEPFKIDKPTVNDILSDNEGNRILSLRSSLPQRTGLFLQLEYSGSCYDTPVELVGVDIRVTGKSAAGVKEAAQTNKSKK